MTTLPTLHVVFTMDVHSAATQSDPEGPRSWQLSAQAVDGYCAALARAGFPATLFLTPRCAAEHEPLVEEVTSYGCEAGLLLHPPSLEGVGGSRLLGHYPRAEQGRIVQHALDQFQDALGSRALTCRGAFFSANDDTFGLLAELGFRQGSLSNPGRQISKHAALWQGAPIQPHFASASNRLERGDLPFFEVPVSSDPGQVRGGLAPDLAIENGTVDAYHRPFVQGHLERQSAESTGFRALCLTTRNCFAYHDRGDRLRQALNGVIDLIRGLGESYTIVPTTVRGAHAAYHTLTTSS